MEFQKCLPFTIVVLCIVETTYDALKNTNRIVPSCKIQDAFVALKITLVLLRYYFTSLISKCTESLF